MGKKGNGSCLRVRHLGPIGNAEVSFGDLTVLVGPQATGKSVFLECLNLVVDTGHIQEELGRHGLDWEKKLDGFLDVYFGEGMNGLWRAGETSVEFNGIRFDLESVASRKRPRKDQSLFFIPAQRVLTLRDGWPRPFSDYSPGDPFAVREFSEQLRMLMERELDRNPHVFPAPKRFHADLKKGLDRDIFCGFGMWVETHHSQRRLVLKPDRDGPSLPFMVWSAGQREFVPLMLGLYWLMPGAGTSRRNGLEWVVIEEVEMGLHPRAISAVLLVVLELLSRGYRVCLSTHSQHVLDLIWAMGACQRHGGTGADLAALFEVGETHKLVPILDSALKKTLKVYHFGQRGVAVRDISRLDPGSDDSVLSGWGGLAEFAGRAADVVSSVVAREARRKTSKESAR